MRLAAAACLMASGLLVAGTGASLALADPESGKPADTGGSLNNSAPPATGDPQATGTSGASAPGSPPGGTGGPSKPSSQVGDGRNGIPSGGTTGTATGTASTHESTHESPSPTETAPTTVTETSSKPTESASMPAPQTGSASASEQASGVTTHVVVAPSVLPQALAAASEKLAAAAAETPPPAAAPVVWWPFNWWNWAIPQVVTPNGGGSDGLPNQVTWQSPIPPGMQLPIPQLPTIPQGLLAPIGGLSFDPFVDAVNGVLTGVNNVVTGLATAASQLPFAQITLPVVVFPGGPAAGVPNGNGGSVGAGGPGIVPRPGIPAAPLPPANPGAGAPPPAPPPAQKQQTPPAFSAGNQASVAPSYRMGYMEYLRAAGFGEVAAVAVPGFTGILILTGAGGLIGYRQARAGSTMRTGNTARFMG
ncbi:MAG: hypothetical protein JWP55_607 [Mycobacterium sp.]|nr:hypothetical protein [Mycobacterium sp.]